MNEAPRLYSGAIRAYAGWKGISYEEALERLLRGTMGFAAPDGIPIVDDGKGESFDPDERDKHGGWR